MNETPKFKVGDVVELNDNYNDMMAKKGYLAKIVSLKSLPKYITIEWITKTSQHNGNYYPNNFKLVESDEFVLPEKWFIRVTKENLECLGKWRPQGAIGQMAINNSYPNGLIFDNGVWTNDCYLENYIEITFEQFKQYVLKDMDNINKENKRNLIPGKIYSYNLEGDDYLERFDSIINGEYYFSNGINLSNEKWNNYLKSESLSEEDLPEEIELATEKQTRWFEACEKANAYISFENFIKPKFEVGKYYYFESYGKSSNTNIARCDRLINNNFQTDDWIMLHDHKHYGSGAWDFKEMSNVREASLQEIQKFNKFEVGRWYKYCGWYIKYAEHIKDVWFSSEEINADKEYKKCKSSFGNRSVDSDKILLTDLSEIQQYLPDDHPDKIVKSIEEWGIGTYVVSLRNTAVGIPKFNTGEIAEIVGFGFGEIYFNDFHWNCHQGCKEVKWFATLKEAEEFSKQLLSENMEEDYQNVMDIEVGDTVKCISEEKSRFGDFMYGFESDFEFVVTEVHDYNTYKVYFGGKDKAGVYSDAVRLVKRKDSNLIIDDLVEGEIYYYDNKFITMYPEGLSVSSFDIYNTTWVWNLNIKKVTEIQRKQWNCCNKQNKFIPESELNKYDNDGNLINCNEIPEYVECIGLQEEKVLLWSHEFKIGEIYKLTSISQCGKYEINSFWCDGSQFKPSTKEAYDAQQNNSSVKNNPIIPSDCKKSELLLNISDEDINVSSNIINKIKSVNLLQI